MREANIEQAESTMLPPSRIIKRGTPELSHALLSGQAELSLPMQYWSSWLDGYRDWNSDERHDASLHNEPLDRLRDESSRHPWAQRPAPQDCANAESRQIVESRAWNHGRIIPTPIQRQNPPISLPYDKDGDEHDKDHDTFREDEPLVDDEDRETRQFPAQDMLPRFNDIIGHSEVKLRLDEILLPVALPPNLVDSVLSGIRSLSASILLFGPPGCGKTQLAKAIAGEAEAAFISVSPSDVLSKYVGESETSLRSYFDKGEETRLGLCGTMLRIKISQYTVVLFSSHPCSRSLRRCRTDGEPMRRTLL